MTGELEATVLLIHNLEGDIRVIENKITILEGELEKLRIRE